MGSRGLIGIDVGGTAVKVALFDLDGRLLALHSTPVPIHTPQPGQAEIDPCCWQEAIANGTRSVLAQADLRPQQVAGIGLSNMIGTVAPLDADHRPLRPAIAYLDTRSVAQAEWILAQAPHVTETTGNRVLPGNTSLAAILWMQAHEPHLIERAATFATVNTLLFAWLTGERRADYTNASFMGVMDYRRRAWSPELAAQLGFDLDLLAPLYPSESTAPLTAGAAETLGLPAGVPVALGGLDGAMTSLGVGAVDVGDCFDASGTSEMVAVCLDRPLACPELLGRWHVVPDRWTLIGAMTTSGACLQWLHDEVYAPGAESATSYDAMLAEASAAPPGAHGVVFLPHLMGERAPIWDPYARGVFFGLTRSTTRGDMARAIIEGTAYAVRHLLELIQERSGVELRRIVMVGGAARNPLWRQVRADVWGLQVVASPVAEAAALGAALTAGVGAGLYADYAAAAGRCAAQGGEVSLPNPAHAAVYDHGYAVYRRLYPALAETMRLAATR
jgi:xylulokinase